VETLNKYHVIRGMVKTGDRLACHSHHLFGRMIRRVTGDFINHEAAIIRYSSFETRSVDLVDIIEAIEGGFIRQPFSEWLAKYPGVVFLHQLRPELENKRTAFGRELLKLRNRDYDWIDCGRCALGDVLANDEKVFCSEAYFLAGKNAGLPIPGDVDPTVAPVPGKEVDRLQWGLPPVCIKGNP
jgi:hypothetical protein